MVSRIRTTPLVFSTILLLGITIPTAAVPADITTLSLRDQFGQTDGLVQDADGLQVAIVVSAKRLRRIKPWEQAIRRIDADVPVIRVADVPRSPPAEYDVVAEKLRKRLPEDLPVLIDLDGIWTETFDLDSDVPNVLIFDGRGGLLARHSGMYKGDQFDALAADLTADSGQSP